MKEIPESTAGALGPAEVTALFSFSMTRPLEASAAMAAHNSSDKFLQKGRL